MSRDPYSSSAVGGGGSRSPRSVRRVAELPTVDRSPSRSYPTSGTGGRGSPLGRKPIRQTRSGNNSPDHGGYGYHHQSMGSPYYSRDDDLGSPVLLDERGRSMGPSGHHRSRSASRPAGVGPMNVRYQSLDRATGMLDSAHEREFMPIREPRERSLDRGGRDRSLERGLYLEEELYGPRSARQSPNPHLMSSREPFIGELQHQNNDLQRELGNLKKELELTNQKLGSSMHSIKTFWSPELKKERALRKEESAKYSLINDQLKLLNSENQKQAMLVRQLEEELRMRMRGPSVEMQQQMEILLNENEHLTREIAILRDTIKELELRIETQKQTLQARDESIKKLLEMLQNKGMGKEEERQMFQQMQAMAQKQLDEFRVEIQRRDQEILAMSAKMKTLEEQHQDYQRHIAVLKESLCAKEEHYNMLQADCEELRQRLEEKNRHIEKKTQIAMQATQDRNRLNNELTELKDHMDIKDRKINVLQRKLELHEANKKVQALQAGGAAAAKAGDDTAAIRKQLDDKMKQIDEQRRNVDSKAKQIDEREKQLSELDRQLKKRKEQMDQLEQSLRKAGGGAAAAGELNKRLTETQKQLEAHQQELEKAREEAKRSASEMERLLQLVQMSQEEQNAKEKTIMELQQALKNAQGKIRSQQQQQPTAQMADPKKKEEVIYENVENATTTKNNYHNENELFSLREKIKFLQNVIEHTNKDTSEQCFTDLSNELEEKGQKIIHLELKVDELESRLSNCDLQKELKKREDRISELERDVGALEQALKDSGNISELEELVDVVRIKNDRIEELEEALRESVRITNEREMVLQEEENRRKQIMEKVGKLEQRLLSLQTAQAMKCHTCRPVVLRMRDIENRLTQLISERRDHLHDLSRMKREALESAISEKDAHLALLEVSGIRTARQAQEMEQLKADRRRLVERLKQEDELTVSLIEEYDPQEYIIGSLDDFDDNHLNLSNGNSRPNSEISTSI